MKKVLLTALLMFVIGFAYAQNQPQCQQVYVCGGGGCQWVIVCR